jgi:hypothetical protein
LVLTAIPGGGGVLSDVANMREQHPTMVFSGMAEGGQEGLTGPTMQLRTDNPNSSIRKVETQKKI